MKIYTRKGDNGTSKIMDGKTLSKDDPVFNLLGDIDELNSHIGLCYSMIKEDKIKNTLFMIQEYLFKVGAYISTNDSKYIDNNDITSLLEKEMDEMNKEIPPLRNLIHPTGVIEACNCHIARTVTRRAERSYITYSKDKGFNEDLSKFLNRLSDYLFICALYINHKNGFKEIIIK